MSPYQHQFARNAHILQKRNLGPRVSCPRYKSLMKELEPLSSKSVSLCRVTGQDHSDLSSRLPPQQASLGSDVCLKYWGRIQRKAKLAMEQLLGWTLVAMVAWNKYNEWLTQVMFSISEGTHPTVHGGGSLALWGESELKSQEAAPSPKLCACNLAYAVGMSHNCNTGPRR